MLRELRIKNFTIIDNLTINFSSGFNVLTGETGAGKSIVVDAIGLLLGDKSSPDMIKSGNKEAQIEAHFDNSGIPLLKDLDIEDNDGIHIRRNISAQGKGRAFVNDTSVSMQTLSNIGRNITDIHGQHEQQGLLKKENHISFLDSFGGLAADADNLKSLYEGVSDLRNKVNELKERIRERGQRIEFLRFQVSEIDSAALKHGEKEAIEEERAILLNLSRLKESSETAYALLYEAEGSCLEKLSSVAAAIKDMANIDQSAKELLDVIEPAVPQIEDAALLLRKFKDKYDMDPRRLDEIEERYEAIKRLEKKYGEGIEGILIYRDKAEEELKGLEQAEEQQESLGSELNKKEEELKKAADALSKKRHSSSKRLESAITGELREVGFQKAEFKADIKKRDEVNSTGCDDVEFLFSANPGEPPKPLIKVASGGELSRIMLAFKCIEIRREAKGAGRETNGRTLIFDEVDSGIGGVTAQHVGKRLKAIAGSYQVLCITHLPQIAAMADNHLKVEKVIKGDNVEVRIEPLSDKDRQSEIARMLSGNITDLSLRHAKELLISRS
jgi:DNA repair protein RecN (Recombination protein N)